MVGLNDINLFSHNSGGYKSEINVPVGLVPLKLVKKGSVLSLFPWLMDSFLCLHIIFPLYISVSKFPLLIMIPLRLGQQHMYFLQGGEGGGAQFSLWQGMFCMRKESLSQGGFSRYVYTDLAEMWIKEIGIDYHWH